MEKTIELEICSLLPGVESDQDSCIKRLETAMQNRREMQKAHLDFAPDGRHILCLHYDPDQISLTEVKHIATEAGAKITNRYRHEVIAVSGMDCSDCALVVEHSLGRMDGMLNARVNYAAQKLWIEYDSHLLTHRSIEQRLRSLGYDVPPDGRRKWLQENRALMMSAMAGLLLAAGWLGETFNFYPAWLCLIFFLAAYLTGGWHIAQHALHAIIERHFDTDLLMVMAALGAAALGEFAEGALLIVLFSLGHALEERTLGKARSAIAALADLTPKTALVRRAGSEEEIPVEQLQIRDLVIIRPGTRIPVDGLILAGHSAINQAPVTGESLPVEKKEGDPVFAGTINGEGSLDVCVTRLAADSTLARVVKMVEEAQGQKSPTQQTMQRFEYIFVPAVLAVTIMVIIVPPLFGASFRDSFLRAMTLLVAASPCALALGAPASILAGIAQAARNGVLVKGGGHLENLGHLRAIAFDKTGTITYGKPEVRQVVSFQPTDFSEKQILALAGAMESRSAHPLAKAVLQAAQSSAIALASVGQVDSITGRGLRSIQANQPILVGSQKFFEEEGIKVESAIIQQVEAAEANGQTSMLLAVGTSVIGMIILADSLRPEIPAVLKKLSKMGIQKAAILTGDNRRVAAAIAQQAGFTEYYADLMPEDKLAAMRDLVDKYQWAGMIGDGVNDAPALAHATVGIALGGAGTDVALESADVALMGDNLERLPFAIGLGRATRKIIRQNLAIALGVMALLAISSLAGWSGMTTAVVLHEGSTVAVVLNALRLLSYKG